MEKHAVKEDLEMAQALKTAHEKVYSRESRSGLHLSYVTFAVNVASEFIKELSGLGTEGIKKIKQLCEEDSEEFKLVKDKCDNVYTNTPENSVRLIRAIKREANRFINEVTILVQEKR